jgi:hypothetical protein
MSDLQTIPGIGKTISKNLARINIYEAEDFAGKNPEELYEAWCAVAQNPYDLDRCVLYVFREAVYFADGGRDHDKLKWWNWKDEK